MILIGELETNNKMIFPDGNTGFLFVGTSLNRIENGKAILNYHYAISPSSDKRSYHVGDMFHTKENLSITEFLQRIVDMDIEIGRNAVIKLGDEVTIRLKGMNEWIKRKKDYSLDAPTY